VSISALDLLNTSVYPWYSFRTEKRSIFSEIVVELAYIVKQNWRENVVKPVRCKAQSRAGTLIIAM